MKMIRTGKTSGFTLVEVIVVVAVLAAVVTMAIPDIATLFERQREMLETFRLKSIYKSLDAYAKAKKALPAKSTWVANLLEFSDLTESQIKTDVWGNDRTYSLFDKEHNYLGGKYKAYYAVVQSMGKNGVEDESAPTSLSGFSSFNIGSSRQDNAGIDDVAIKYTDQANKIKLLETTLNRMDKLSTTLAKYARVKRIQGITTDPLNSDSYIYFPKDGRAASDPALSKYFTGVDEITTGQNNAVELAKLLGLPEEYGQDALISDDEVLNGKFRNMWYISNPGADGSNICNGSRTVAPFYPPVIMIGSDGNPCT